MAKTPSGSAPPGGKGSAKHAAHRGAAAAKTTGQPARGGAPPAVPAAAVTAPAAGGDGPCFEFRQEIDADGNPVLRKVQVPCPEK